MDYKRIAQITLPIVSADNAGLLEWAQAVLESQEVSEFVGVYLDAVIELAEFVSVADRAEL